MAQVIRYKGGRHTFEPVELFHGRKRIDINTSEKNLLDFRQVLVDTQVRWFLGFGTLLGAVREKGFIEHDEDTDVYVLNEDRRKFLKLLPEFLSRGFTVARYEWPLLSLIREDDYIDVYFLRRMWKTRKMMGFHFPKTDFINGTYLNFLGVDFPAPSKPISHLELLYGADWKVPKVGAHAVPHPRRVL